MSEKEISFEDVQKMTVDDLKAVLRRKGLKLDGRKEVLVARVFYALENQIPDVLSVDEKNAEKALTYKRLLQVGNNTSDVRCLPDPFKLEEGWLTEAVTIQTKKLPPTVLSDIIIYLYDTAGTGDFHKRLLCEYKERKAMNYLTSGWLSELEYHHISDTEEMCFLRSSCAPSQKVGEKCHQVWAAINKSDGTVHSAFCTCMAGYGQTCNHIGAMLLRIDAIWQEGGQIKECTSLPCTWGPKAKQAEIVPKMVKDMVIGKKKLSEKGSTTSNINCTPKRRHVPHNESKGLSFQEFALLLEREVPEAVYLAESSEIRRPAFMRDESQFENLKPPLCTIIQSGGNIQQYFDSLTGEEKVAIERATVQNVYPERWKEYRKCILTATQFHTVSSRMKRIRSGQSTSGENDKFLSTFLQGGPVVSEKIPSIRYGRVTESIAADFLFSHLKREKHRNLKMYECGLMISDEFSFLGATPDRKIVCDCHGKRLVEIKCPYSCKGKPITSSTCSYVTFDGCQFRLKRSDPKYYQVQGQLGCSGLKSCLFLVYSRGGYMLEEIYLDEEFWSCLKEDLKDFYLSVVMPALVVRNH